MDLARFSFVAVVVSYKLWRNELSPVTEDVLARRGKFPWFDNDKPRLPAAVRSLKARALVPHGLAPLAVTIW
jgi:hypothetical protein